MLEQGGPYPLRQIVQGVPDDCFGSMSVLFVNDFPFFKDQYPYISVLGCDTPVNWLIGFVQLENGSDSPFLVSTLMSIKLYVSQDLLNHGCRLCLFHFFK